jgi:hypothetical protein
MLIRFEKIAFCNWVRDTHTMFNCTLEELSSEYLKLQGI